MAGERRDAGPADNDVPVDLLRSALDRFAIPVIVVAADARILHTNGAAAAFLESGSQLASLDGALHCTGNAQGDERLHAAIRDMTGPRDHSRQHVRVVPLGEGRVASLHAIVFPLRAEEGVDAAGVFVFDRERSFRINCEVIEILFDLSPAEARVVMELMQGLEVRDIARQLSISVHTVRTHIRSVLLKTGTSSQRHLIRLIALGLGPLILDL